MRRTNHARSGSTIPRMLGWLGAFLGSIAFLLSPFASVYASNPPPPSAPEPTVFTLGNQQAKVDNTTGALTETIPLDLPPGRNGLQPNLSLNYDSQNTDNDNIVGYGWSLSIPYIERLNKTGSQDLFGSSPYFTSSIDGELIGTSGVTATTTATSTAPVSVSYLVVGGGSSPDDCAGASGGGGGGQVRTGSTTVATGFYIITVGTGATTPDSCNEGNNGGTSSFNGITAAGANGVGGYSGPGNSGGSGGSINTGGSAGGPAGGGGGGGGGNSTAGGSGGSGMNSNGGTGGAGTSSSITGTAVGYGGGGGGESSGTGTEGSGTDGGGGSNGPPTANSGGGAGPGEAGADGIVVISAPTGTFTATTSGATSFAQSGGNDIWTFTSGGVWTPSELATTTATTTTWTSYSARVDTGADNQYTYATSTNSWIMYDKSGKEYIFGASSSAQQYGNGTVNLAEWGAGGGAAGGDFSSNGGGGGAGAYVSVASIAIATGTPYSVYVGTGGGGAHGGPSGTGGTGYTSGGNGSSNGISGGGGGSSAVTISGITYIAAGGGGGASSGSSGGGGGGASGTNGGTGGSSTDSGGGGGGGATAGSNGSTSGSGGAGGTGATSATGTNGSGSGGSNPSGIGTGGSSAGVSGVGNNGMTGGPAGSGSGGASPGSNGSGFDSGGGGDGYENSCQNGGTPGGGGGVLAGNGTSCNGGNGQIILYAPVGTITASTTATHTSDATYDYWTFTSNGTWTATSVIQTPTYKWMLQKVVDTNTNYIQYTYTKDNNQIYPYQIIYTGHGSTAGPTVVTFATSTRPDAHSSYKDGFKVYTNYLISSITASFNGTNVRQYNLSYTTGINGARSLLSGIQESGWSDQHVETALPAMSFSYIASTTPFMWPGSTRVAGQGWIVGDIKGDGKNSTSVFYNNNGSLYGNVFQDGSSATTSVTAPDYWASTCSGCPDTNPPSEHGVRFLDLNGSGTMDLVGGLWNYTSGTGANELDLGSSTSLSWTATTSWNGVIPYFAETGSSTIQGQTLGIFGDVNGTGLPSFEQRADGWGLPGEAYLANGDGWNSGRSDIFKPPTSLPYGTSTPGDPQLVDINGDGLPDWVYSDGTNIYVYLNAGTGWESAPDPEWTVATSTLFFNSSNGSYYDRGIRFIDLTGDGLPDLVHSYTGVSPGDTGTYSEVLMNTGHGFATTTLYTTLPGYITSVASNGNTTFNEYENWMGNGQQAQDVISTITYPRGGSTSVTYGYTAQSGTNPNLPYSLLTVTKLINHNGEGSNEETDYAYAGGKQYLPSDVFDRKFAGFASTTMTDANGSTVTYFSQGATTTPLGDQEDGYPQLNFPFRTDVFSAVGTLLRKTFYRYDAYWHGASVFVGLGRQVEQDYASDGSHRDKASDFTYATSTDSLIKQYDYGEVIGNSDGTFSTSTALGPTRTILYSYVASSTVNMTMLMQKAIISPAGATTSETQYEYDGFGLGQISKGNMTKERDWVTANTFASTTLNYNTYGLVSTSTNPNTQATAYTYDSFNLYPATTTNALRQLTQYTYDYSNGEVEQTTNPNGGITLNSYDGLGRLSEVQESNVASPASLLTKTLFTYVDSTSTPSLVEESDYLNTGSTTSTTGTADLAMWGAGGSGAIQGQGGGAGTYVAATGIPITSGQGYTVTIGQGGQAATGPSTGGLGGSGYRSGGNGSNATNAAGGGGGGSSAVDFTSSGGSLYIASGGAGGTQGPSSPSNNSATGSSGGTGNNSTSNGAGGGGGSGTAGGNASGTTGGTGGTGGTTQTGTNGWDAGNTAGGSSAGASGNGNNAVSGRTGGAGSGGAAGGNNSGGAGANGTGLDSGGGGGGNLGSGVGGTGGVPGGGGGVGPGTNNSGAGGNGKVIIYAPLGTITSATGGTHTSDATYDYWTFSSSGTWTPAVSGTSSASASMVTTYNYYDGLSRPIQERKTSATAGLYTVGDTVYNSVGTLASSSLPYFSSGSSNTSATTTSALYTSYLYDELHRLVSTINSVGSTTNTYSKWTTTATDPDGHIKDTISDAYGNLAQVVEHGSTANATTTYAYDAAGNLATTTDANGNIRTFTYDGLGRTLSATDLHASGASSYGKWFYSYDPIGNVASTTDPKSQNVTYTYDGLNRLLSETLVGYGTQVSNTYDACTNGIGYLCTASSTGAYDAYAYDVLGRQTVATTTVASATYALGYSYDLQGNPTSVTLPDSSVFTYAYNSAGLVSALSRTASGATSTIANMTAFAPTNAIEQLVFGSQASTTYSYDPTSLYRLTNILTLGATTITSTTTNGVANLAMWGGGGGGGNTDNVGEDGGGGGGAGAFVSQAGISIVSGTPYTVTVGQGGNGANGALGTGGTGFHNGGNGTADNTNYFYGGGGGGSSAVTFSSTYIAAGGGGGSASGGGAAASGTTGGTGGTGGFMVGGGGGGGGANTNGSNASSINGGAGGTGGTSVTGTGGAGGTGTDPSNSWSGGGGSSAGISGNGSNGVVQANPSGGNGSGGAAGGSGAGGGGGNGTNGSGLDSGGGGGGSGGNSGGSGGVGGLPGAGGGGAYFGSSGNGASGEVIIYAPLGTVIASTTATHTSDAMYDYWTFTSNGTWTPTTVNSISNALQNLTYTYDADGNILTRTDNSALMAGGQSTAYTYDNLNRLTSASTAGVALDAYVQNYAYNLLGSMTTGPGGTYTYGGGTGADPDAVTQTVLTSGGSAPTIAYDNSTLAGNGTPASSLTFSHTTNSNTSGLIIVAVQEAPPTGSCSTDKITGVTYNGTALTDLSYYVGNTSPVDGAVKTYYGYAPSQGTHNVVVSASASCILYVVSATYTGVKQSGMPDASGTGNPLNDSGSVSLFQATTTTSSYNAWPILVGVPSGSGLATAGANTTVRQQQSGDLVYADSNGPITSPSPADLSWSTSSSLHWLANFFSLAPTSSIAPTTSTTTYRYDLDGNLIQATTGATTTTYAYDYHNRLVGFRTTGSSATTTYAYDATGNRVLEGTGTATTTFADQYYSVTSILSGTTTTATSTEYAYDGSTLLATIDQLLVNGTATGTPVTRYVSSDNLGSTNVTTDTNGNLAQWLDYYPYGAVRINQDAATTSAVRTYIGQYSDASGLSYLNARYYNPNQGQFLNQDPIFLSSPSQQNLQDPQSLNPYSYSEDNPVSKSDPNGKGVLQGSVAAGWLVGGGTLSLDIDTTNFGAQVELGPSVGPSIGARFSGSYDSRASLTPAGAYLQVSAGAALIGGANYSSEAPLVWQNGNFSRTTLPPGTISPAAGFYVGATDSVVYKTTPIYFGGTNYANSSALYCQSSYTYNYNSTTNVFQQVSQRSQTSGGGGSGGSGSFTGTQIQALAQVASSFGFSSLTSSQVQAAVAVKAAFSH